MSEEGSEHNNKYVRQNREHHARQFSQKVNLNDVFKRSTHSSDPQILRLIANEILPKRKKHPVSDELKPLLLNPTNDFADSESSASSDGFESNPE